MSELLAAGSYQAVIVGHDLVTIGDRETPAVQIDVKIDENTFRKVLLWMTERAIESTVKTLRSLGFTGSLPELEMENEENSGLLETPVKVSVKHSEYNGKSVERLNIYPAHSRGTPLEKSKLTALEKLFRKADSKLQEGGRDEATEEADPVDSSEDTQEEAASAPPPKAPAKRVVAPANGKTKVVSRGFRDQGRALPY